VFVVLPPPCTRGNEANNDSTRILIVETVGSFREEPEVENHLHMEKARGSLWSYSTVVLSPHVDYPLRRGTKELVRILCGYRYLGENTRVIHESLHLYICSLAFTFTLST
jgi:hypothetical protein